MALAAMLALLASFFTATSSVCQRIGAAPAPGGDSFSVRLMLYLVRQPIWLIGILTMILGFVFQVTALRYGGLALVQPVIATELLFVFGFMAIRTHGGVTRQDWLSATAMAAGLGIFLVTASPQGGSDHASAAGWIFSGVSCYGLAVLITAAAYAKVRRGRPVSVGRKAALLGIATGVTWGFVAAIIKELSSHLGGGFTGVFSTWSPYALAITGVVSMVMLSNAFQAGPLAASQPGLTIVDPLIASLLGVLLFNEHISTSPEDIAWEVVSLVILVAGVIGLSHSRLVHGDPTVSTPETSSRLALETAATHGGTAAELAGVVAELPSWLARPNVDGAEARSSASAGAAAATPGPGATELGTPGRVRPHIRRPTVRRRRWIGRGQSVSGENGSTQDNRPPPL